MRNVLIAVSLALSVTAFVSALWPIVGDAPWEIQPALAPGIHERSLVIAQSEPTTPFETAFAIAEMDRLDCNE